MTESSEPAQIPRPHPSHAGPRAKCREARREESSNPPSPVSGKGAGRLGSDPSLLETWERKEMSVLPRGAGGRGDARAVPRGGRRAEPRGQASTRAAAETWPPAWASTARPSGAGTWGNTGWGGRFRYRDRHARILGSTDGGQGDGTGDSWNREAQLEAMGCPGLSLRARALLYHPRPTPRLQPGGGVLLASGCRSRTAPTPSRSLNPSEAVQTRARDGPQLRWRSRSEGNNSGRRAPGPGGPSALCRRLEGCGPVGA